MDRHDKKKIAAPAAEAAYQFQPDDFSFRANTDVTRIDTNFASESFWNAFAFVHV